MNLKSNRPLPKTAILHEQRLTNCTVCRYGIYRKQEYVWTSIGMIHKGCVEDEN